MTPRPWVCLVTRGDVPLDEIREAVRPLPVRIYDNSVEQDMSVFGRYCAAADAADEGAELVYVQDDDCVLDGDAIEALLAAWEPGHLVANMPQQFRHDFYVGHCLVGFGAVFEPALMLDAFWRFWSSSYRQVMREPDWHRWFLRTCDIPMTALVPRILVDVPVRNLPHATGDDRMYRQPEHVSERKRMLELVREIK